MKNQQPEMPPHPTQQPTSREMQLWQQQIMLKQLQELQKQQQYQQLDQAARHQNLLGQAATKQEVVNRLPPLLNGIPVNDASNYMLPRDIMDGESKIPGNSQMFIAGNMNWALGRGLPVVHEPDTGHGFMYSNDDGKATRSMELTAQQIDQSLYGMPVSSSRGLLERYPQIQSSNFTNMMTKAVVQSASNISFHNDQCPVQSSLQDALNATVQRFQQKGFSGNATSNSSQKANHSQHNVQTQEVHGREGQAGWSADIEKASTVVGPSHGMTSLDPTEEKILFGSDDDGNWAASLNALHDNSDRYSAFPSTQSGSWSALMQEAVQASSSDQGFQEEWCGLSLQNTEPLSGNHAAVSNGIGKHQIAWNNNSNLPGAFPAPSRANPLFNDAAAGSNCPTAHSFLHSIRGAYEHNDTTHTDTSNESFQQSSKDVQNMDFDHSSKQRSFDENSLQAHIQLHNVPNGVWSKDMYAQCAKTAHSVSMEFNSHNDVNIWTPQHNILLCNVSSQPSATSTDWNISLASSSGKITKVQDNDGRVLYSPNELKRKDHSDCSILDVGQNCMKEPAKCVIGGSQMHSEVSSVTNFADGKHSNTLNTNQDMNHHVLNRHEVDVMKHVAFDSLFKSRGENVEKYQHGPYAQDSVVNDIDHSPSVSDSQTSSGLSGWKSAGSHRSQHQNVGRNIELQRSINGPQDIQHRSSIPNQESPSSASFDESTADFVQSAKICQTRQNMLELLHKVDQSKDTSTVSALVHSNRYTPHDPYESASSVGSDFHPQRHQTSGVGLRSALPPRQQSLSNQTLFCQTSLLISDSSQLEPEAEDKDHVQSAFVACDQSPHPSRVSSQSEIQGSRQNLSEQASKQVLYSLSQGNSSAVMPSNLPYLTQRLQLQQKQQYLQQQRAFGMRGSQTGADDRARYASLRRHTQNCQYQAINQATQKASTTLPSRLFPFKLASTADIHAPSSEFNSPDTGHSQSINSDFYRIISSGQQTPRSETGPILQASSASRTSQQIGSSTMSHNVWTNASIQQRTSGGQKLNPAVPQSIILDSSFRAPDSATVKEDDQRNKEEQEQVPKHHSDGNSAVLSSMESLPRQDLYMSKHCQEALLKPQPDHVSLPNLASSNSDIGTYGPAMTPSDVQHPNYVLLQQVQAMKGADSDANKMVSKRLKGDFSSDASQGYIYGQNASFKVPADGELGIASANSLSPNVKMLSFSVRENEEKFSGETSQILGREMASQDIHTSGQHDCQIQSQSLSSTLNYMGRNVHTQISPQMSRSWFEHYSKYKNDRIPAIYDGQRSAKAASQQYSPAEVSERMTINPLVEQKLESSQFPFMDQSRSPSKRAGNDLSPCEPLDIVDQDMIMRTKKCKTATTELLPWHMEVVHGYQRLKSNSSAEHDWAEATKRLTEKVEGEAGLVEDVSLVPRARRRLVLSTQLIQQLLPSVPSPILVAEAISSYESVTYFLAKSALGRACSLVSCSGSDSREHLDIGNRIVGKVWLSEKANVLFFSKTVEDFIGRSKQLESDLLRLDKRNPLLDVRLECQDLERFSLVNRLGKFHGRSQTDGAESTSTSQNATRKLFPQRYVTALSISGNLPEGVICLSL